MKSIYERIYETGIIPVIKIEDAANAVPLAKALIDGGLPAAEITFRTAAAADAIKAITEAYPDMVVGAGTVLNAEQADAAKAAGAQFIVSPGLNPNTVKPVSYTHLDVYKRQIMRHGKTHAAAGCAF